MGTFCLPDRFIKKTYIEIKTNSDCSEDWYITYTFLVHAFEDHMYLKQKARYMFMYSYILHATGIFYYALSK